MLQIKHRNHRSTLRASDGDSNWRSRMVILAVMTTALGIYAAGLLWFGRGLADDVRAGIHEVQAGALILDRER